MVRKQKDLAGRSHLCTSQILDSDEKLKSYIDYKKQGKCDISPRQVACSLPKLTRGVAHSKRKPVPSSRLEQNTSCQNSVCENRTKKTGEAK